VDEVRTTWPAPPNHTLEFGLPAEPVVIDGGGARLAQVLHNLVNNAVKYSPKGGTIHVRVAHTATEAVLEVTDAGIGIPAAEHAYLFAPLYRASNVAWQISGFGVGLHLVKEIVERQGGRIAVSSTEEAGSTFRVVLPLAAPTDT
jgi:signal transduction histidine kinase